MKDREELKLALEKFNFVVEMKQYESKRDIKEQLKGESAGNYENYSAILVAVLTHERENGDWYGSMLSKCDPQEILCKPFTQETPGRETLAGKPKIFLFSACRGEVSRIFISKSKLRQNCSLG